MNIYLKKELTREDLPSYYIVYEFNNKTLVYEITSDYIELRKDIDLKSLKIDYILLEDLLKYSMYVEDGGVLYFEYDEAYQLGEDTKKNIQILK